MKKYYRRLALKRIIFCFIYTLLVMFLISYCSDRYSITTSNITMVKSIESNRMKSRIMEHEEISGNIKFIYKTIPYEVNCLEKSDKIKNNLYNDATYGAVYILKTNSSYPCKSILKIKNDKNLEIYGIILDKDSNISKNNVEILTDYSINLLINEEEKVNFSIERYGY